MQFWSVLKRRKKIAHIGSFYVFTSIKVFHSSTYIIIKYIFLLYALNILNLFIPNLPPSIIHVWWNHTVFRISIKVKYYYIFVYSEGALWTTLPIGLYGYSFKVVHISPFNIPIFSINFNFVIFLMPIMSSRKQNKLL